MSDFGYHPMPQPDDIQIREREDAMGAYLMMFAALAAGLPLPIINLVASLIYYFVNKNKSRFVKFHVVQSLYSQFPTTLLNAGLVFWTIRIFALQHWEYTDYYKGYVAMVIVANLIYFVFSIVASVKARKGQFYYFLFFGKLAYHVAYAIKEEEAEGNEPLNQPPSL